MMRLFIFLAALFPLLVNGATYYIDWSAGSDSNSGTSTNTPWKRHPYMRLFGGTYTHAAGDGFVFRGGVTWPSVNFTMQIMRGGTPEALDYYGYNTNWYTGASWSRPIFDAEGVELAGGYDVMVLFNLLSPPLPNNVVIDGIEMRNLYWNGPKSFSQVSFVNLSQSTNIVVNNCYFHNWSHGTYGAGTRDDLKCIVGSNSSPFNPACLVQDCTFDGENATNATNGSSSGEGTYAYSGNVFGCTFRNMTSGTIVTGPAGGTIPQIVSGCNIGPVYVSFDQDVHTDGIFMNGGSLFYWHDNVIHDCAALSIFCGNGSGPENTYIWNNLIYNTPSGNPPVVVDNPIAPSCHVSMWNNTFVGGNNAAIRVQNRNNLNLASLDLRNNHAISDAGLLTIDPGVSITALTNQNNLTLSVASASVQGYSLANLYQPTSSSAPTVNAGADLSGISMTPFPFRVTKIGTNVSPSWLNGYSQNPVRQFLGTISGAQGSAMISSDLKTQAAVTLPITNNLGHTYVSDRAAYLSNVVYSIDHEIVFPFQPHGLHIRRFTANAPLTTSLTPIDVHDVGDTNSIACEFVTLASGGVISTWYQTPPIFTNSTWNILVGASYLPPGSSTWIDHYPIFIAGSSLTNGALTSIRNIVGAQHPADGSAWFFFKRDSFARLDAFRCVESAGDIVVTPFPGILDDTTGAGEWAPEGENIIAVAAPDPSRNAILVAYQRDKFMIFSGSPFYKGAYLGIAPVPVTGIIPTNTIISLDQWIERISPYGFMVAPDGTIDVMYNTISAAGISTVGQISTYAGGSWQTPRNFESDGIFFCNNPFQDTIRYFNGFQHANKMLTRTPPSGADILNNIRPQGSAWDIGAYEFLGTNGTPGILSLSSSAFSVNQGAFSTTTANRAGGTAGAVSVSVATANGTAVAGIDYSPINSSFSWADGATGARSLPLTILSSGASVDKTFTITISSPTGGASLGPITTTTVTILGTIPQPPTNGGTFTFTSASFATTETSGSTVITVQRTGGTNLAASVNFFTQDSSAVSGFDYTGVSGTLSWTANENGVKTFTIPILNTGTPSGTKSFNVKLSSPTAGSALAIPNSAVVTITMNATPIPGSVALSTPGTTVPQSGGSVLISVIRSGGTNNAVTVLASTANVTATAGVDYTATSQTLAWADGEGGVKTMLVPIINSGIQSATDRSFTVNLSAVTGGATIGSPSTEIVTILMPRPLQGGTIAITTNLFNTSLAAGSVAVTINRSGSANAAGSVQYQTVNGTAAAGTDYLATSGTLNWSANDNSTKTITVPILNSGASGPNRTFSFQIFNPSSGVTLGLTNSIVSIALNAVVIPGVIRLTSSSTNVNQNGGSVQICATRTSGTNGVVTVLGTTFNGTATAAIDYTAVTQTLTWANGEGGTKCLTVPIINSGIISATDRTFTLGLTNVTGGATIGSPSNEVVTIIMPKPAAGSIALSQSSYSVSETNGSLTITVFRTGSTNVAGSVHYSTQNGSAVAGFDYTTTVGDLTWGVNDNTPRTFLIPILNTGSIGPNRVFRVNLTNATGSNLGSPGSALISIRMDAIISLQGAMTIGGRVTLGGSMVLGGH